MTDGKVVLPKYFTDAPFKGGECKNSAWRTCPDFANMPRATRGNKETEDQLANRFTKKRAELQIEKAEASGAP